MDFKLSTINCYSSYEIVIERSRFIAHLFPTTTASDAVDAIKLISKKHYDATHNCTAYILGNPISGQKANDDGEPKSTAGLPMLQALNNRNMTNITVIVTRYFGGTKLGAGGLIRAYCSAVTTALDHADIFCYQKWDTLKITLSYDELNTLYYLRDTTQFFTINQLEYGTQIDAEIALLALNLDEVLLLFEKSFMRIFSRVILSSTIKIAPVPK